MLNPNFYINLVEKKKLSDYDFTILLPNKEQREFQRFPLEQKIPSLSEKECFKVLSMNRVVTMVSDSRPDTRPEHPCRILQTVNSSNLVKISVLFQFLFKP